MNFFDYWTYRDKTPILSALGINPEGEHSLDFEGRFPTGLGGTPPHLDVAITTQSTGFVHAVEAKFTEHLKRSTKSKSEFRKAYFPESGELGTREACPPARSSPKTSVTVNSVSSTWTRGSC